MKPKKIVILFAILVTMCLSLGFSIGQLTTPHRHEWHSPQTFGGESWMYCRCGWMQKVKYDW